MLLSCFQDYISRSLAISIDRRKCIFATLLRAYNWSLFSVCIRVVKTIPIAKNDFVARKDGRYGAKNPPAGVINFR
jgi:hypothetical protein